MEALDYGEYPVSGEVTTTNNRNRLILVIDGKPMRPPKDARVTFKPLGFVVVVEPPPKTNTISK